jgi:orotidine-5'-phosphate decarboxylase
MAAMHQHVADRLDAAITSSGSIACVGLDPRPALLPPALRAGSLARHGDSLAAVADAFLAFNRGLIDAVAGACAALKPQAACYEAYGWRGMQALSDSISYARERGIPVILDAKRGDIGSTAEHYRQAYLGAAPGLGSTQLGGAQADWMTINGYLGSDGVTPFLDAEASRHGVFVLVKTSNPSSGELQDLALAGAADGPGTVMAAMACMVERWGRPRRGRCGLSDVGAVVGATYPEQARSLRALMPDSLFLVPGYGAQGGSAADALAGARPGGGGVLVNSSRAIIAAWQKDNAGDWAAAARGALDEMNRDLNRVR